MEPSRLHEAAGAGKVRVSTHSTGRSDSIPMNHPYACPAAFGTESLRTKKGFPAESVAMTPKTALPLASDGGATGGEGSDARIAGATARKHPPRATTNAGHRTDLDPLVENLSTSCVSGA